MFAVGDRRFHYHRQLGSGTCSHQRQQHGTLQDRSTGSPSCHSGRNISNIQKPDDKYSFGNQQWHVGNTPKPWRIVIIYERMASNFGNCFSNWSSIYFDMDKLCIGKVWRSSYRYGDHFVFLFYLFVILWVYICWYGGEQSCSGMSVPIITLKLLV